MFAIIKSLFRPSPADRAIKKCAAAGRDLLTTVLMFHESHKLAGTDFQPDESSLDALGMLVAESGEPEHTLPAIAAFLGCIITEQLGGTWQRTPDGHYCIVGVGPHQCTVNIAKDIQARLSPPDNLTPRTVYESIRDRIMEPKNEC